MNKHEGMKLYHFVARLLFTKKLIDEGQGNVESLKIKKQKNLEYLYEMLDENVYKKLVEANV